MSITYSLLLSYTAPPYCCFATLLQDWSVWSGANALRLGEMRDFAIERESEFESEKFFLGLAGCLALCLKVWCTWVEDATLALSRRFIILLWCQQW